MIQQEHAIVYRCTTKGRRYFSLSAAIRAGAEAMGQIAAALGDKK